MFGDHKEFRGHSQGLKDGSGVVVGMESAQGKSGVSRCPGAVGTQGGS